MQLAWRVLARAKAELTRRLVLLDVDGRELARHDGPSAAAGYGPAEWRGGQLVVEDFSLPVPAAARATELRLQWLDRGSGAPVPLADGATELVLPGSPG